jgi:hypothetical protein
MSPAQAKKVFLLSLLVSAVVVGWESVSRSGSGHPLPPFRSMVALVVVAVALGVGVEVAPQIFGPLALLIALSFVIGKAPAAGGKSKFVSLYGATAPGAAK